MKQQSNLTKPKPSYSLRFSLLSLIKIYVPILVIIFAVWFVDNTTDISAYELVGDPTEVGLIPPYMGFVSQIGVLLFCCAVAICLFTAHLITNSDQISSKWGLFLKVSGYFLLILLLDDLFQVHEHFSTLLFGTEADIAKHNRKLQDFLEMVVFVIYGLFSVFYVVYFRKLIYRTKFSIIIVACVFFAASLFIDFVFVNDPNHFLIEEGLKLLGIVTLVTYYIKVCYDKLLKLFLTLA